MNEPIDMIHAVSVRRTEEIRTWVAERRAEIAAWVPAPMPADWRTTRAPRRVAR